ncbi:MAG: DUF3306 domain-containing protein [Gammaproteobacteria bacterium]|nr:DUF3306 domain-containing protein [Gammaproteobacteria bacterium]
MSRRPRANDDTEHGLLRRWSKRKSRSGPGDGSRAPSQGDDTKSPDEHGAEAAVAKERAPEAGPDESVKTDDDMPDLDSINETSDLSDFFSPGVSENLRNQALRCLFRTSKFNITDGLDDYNQDFRNFELLGDMVTSDMRHRMEVDEQRRKDAAEAEEDALAKEPAAENAGEDAEPEDRETEQAAGDSGRRSSESGMSGDTTGMDENPPSRAKT